MAWPDPTKLQPFVRIFPRDALGTYLLEFELFPSCPLRCCALIA